VSRELVSRYPQGALFRNRDGNAFSRNSIVCRFRRLRERLPHLTSVTAYCYRHTFTTEALTRGVGLAQVAELLGHSGTEMVMRHYQHLAEKVEYMRAAAAQAVGAGESSR
jgi:integrase